MKDIKEEDGVHEEWYKRARDMRLKDLPEFLRELTEEYNHDYGTICHAIASAAVAAAWAVERSPQGGITGFQAGAVMWQFITEWESQYKDKPVRLVDYSNMLYPQYADKFDKQISQGTWEYLQKEASKNLESRESAAPAVLTHWQSIANGKVPFGYTVKGES